MEDMQIIEINPDNILELGICGYKSLKREGFPEKVAWMENRIKEGLKIKILLSPIDGNQGMIEYIPGKYAWRAVEAEGYMFIHCIFLGFKKAYKGKGFGTRLLEECIRDARHEGDAGVAAVTRKGSFMSGKALFLKNGFAVVDKAEPDFELVALSFEDKPRLPRFRPDWEDRLKPFRKGLFIIRADQCPYTVKNVREICETAEKKYGIQPEVVQLKNYKEAQSSPSPFGTFCIILDGSIITHHPISRRRFENIMDRLTG